jgi:predicted permease
MRQLLRRAWYLLRQGRADDDLAEELEFHGAMKARDLEARGLEPVDAAFATRRALGSVALARDQSRDVWIPRALQGIGQDFRIAVRTLRATPIVTAVAVLSLALGIGANTAIFSIVDSLVLRALPVTDPQRLATVTGGLGPTSTFPYAVWTEIQRRAATFDGALAWSSLRFNLAQGGEMQPVSGMFVTGEFFTTLGVPAIIGRTFTAADDVRGGGADGAVAVISYGFWQSHFGGAAAAIGASLVIERVPYTVVGVTPPAFYGPEVGKAFDVAVPLNTDPLIRGKDTTLDNPTNFFANIMVRLKPDQSLGAGSSALKSLQPQIRTVTMPPNLLPRFQAEFLREPLSLQSAATGTSGLRQRYVRPLLTILAVVGLVLLIACANIANLQLARTAARRHELSVRVALGASQWRLARQLLVESLVLATTGALAGAVLAAWASRLLVRLLSTTVNTVFLDLSLDWRVLAFMMLVTAVTTVLFGALPAFRASGAAPHDALKEQGRATVGGTAGTTASGLVVAQVALSLMLVVAAGLFTRTFIGLATLPLGFDSDRVVVVNVNAMRAHIAPANRMDFYYRLVDAVAAVPGVGHAGGSVISPVSGAGMNNFVEVPGAPDMSESESTSLVNFVTPGWFAAYGTPIHAGRDVSDRDTKTAPSVTLVNEAFVRKFFPGRSALGGSVKFFAGRSAEVQLPKIVVGVVADAVYRSLRDPAVPTMYVPLAQFDFPFPMTGISIGVRASSGSPLLLARSVASALTTVDPGLAFNFRSLADQVDASLTQERIVAMLAGFFGGLALLLAGLGLYGVTAYAVSRRRREIGIRMALGAAPAGVVRLVLSRVTMLVGLGVVIGAVVSLWASRFVAPLLYGLPPRDPATLIGAVGVLTTVGALAAWLPARRASRIDPAVVLRDE